LREAVETCRLFLKLDPGASDAAQVRKALDQIEAHLREAPEPSPAPRGP
jgi:hypothetical protein